MANISKKELEATYAAEQAFIKENLNLLQQEYSSLNSIFDIKKRNAIQQEIIKNNEKLILDMQNASVEANQKGYTIHGNTINAINKQIRGLRETNKSIQDSVDKSNKRLNVLNKITGVLTMQNQVAIQMFKTLNEQDKIIRETIRNLGMSGIKAEQMRGSFESAAVEVAQLGGSLKDIQTVQQAFAEETGRARVMTHQMSVDIAEIGFGTALGVEQAARMAAQFEIMGVDVGKTKALTQIMVNNGEKYGINTGKALKNLEANFKKLNSYTFRTGVKGMMDMALYAEKMKVDMSKALDAAEIARGLEGAVDLAAKLQVMGGEFAKTDPFEMLFLSRNDPAKFAEKISDMTKNIVSFRKMADGTFEKFISPADRDRLKAVGESLGMNVQEMTEMALRSADLTKMAQELSGISLSKDQKEIIKGAAIFNSKRGLFEVQVGNQMKAISELTENDAKAFTTQQSLLKDRAKAAQDFETALNQTITSLRSLLLPILRGVNSVIETVRPVVEVATKWIGGLLDSNIGKSLLFAGGVLMAAGGVWKGVINGFKNSLIGSMIWGKGAAGVTTPTPPTATGSAARRTRLNRNVGLKSMRGGIGMGAASLGIGAGVGAASAGISLLATSIKDVDTEKLKQMNISLGILGGTMLGLGIAGAALAPALPAMLGFGGAVALIGAGVGVAAWGIGQMAKGLSTVIDSGKNAGDSLFKIAGGISAIGAATATGGLGMLLGSSGLIVTLGSIAAFSKPISVVGDAFQKISTVLSGRKEDFIAIQEAVKSISTMTIAKDSALAQLANSFNKPIKVEFADKNVAIATNITLEIDGEKFMRKVVNQKALVQIMKND